MMKIWPSPFEWFRWSKEERDYAIATRKSVAANVQNAKFAALMPKIKYATYQRNN